MVREGLGHKGLVIIKLGNRQVFAKNRLSYLNKNVFANGDDCPFDGL